MKATNDYALVYQAGIANVFALENVPDGQKVNGHDLGAVRVLQYSFSPCEWFCLGLNRMGAKIWVFHCNMAGDIARADWDSDLDNAPFRENMSKTLMSVTQITSIGSVIVG